MDGIVLFDDHGFEDLLPLTYWRPVCELRVGRKIILDRTAQRLGRAVKGVWTRPWLAAVAAQRCGAPANAPAEEGDILVNSRWLPVRAIDFPAAPHVGRIEGDVAFVVLDKNLAQKLRAEDLSSPACQHELLDGVETSDTDGSIIRYPWDIVGRVAASLTEDWHETDVGVESEPDPRLVLDEPSRIHLGFNSRVHPTAVLDTTKGPIFISHDVSVGALAVIEGPAYIGPGTCITAHAHLHGGVGIGPVCKVGGEIDACIIDGYSNKQHDGYLGHAYVGRWVNIGAGTENSDLKNTYSPIRAAVRGRDVDTGGQFFGGVIGDHAKLGINTSIPCGAIIGFAAMVATSHVLPKFVPSFAWITDSGVTQGMPDRLLDVATRMMVRRNVDMTDAEIELFLDLGERCRQFEPASS